MGAGICTCLTFNCEYNENLTQQNILETQLSTQKILYLNSITANNYSKTNRQQLLHNSVNYTNFDTITNLNQYQFNQTDNKTITSNLAIKTKQDNYASFPYLDYNTLTKYMENVELINKISAVYKGRDFRKKYSNELYDKLISFEQKLIYKFNQKIFNDNPNLEKSINKFGDKILDYQNCWKKYYKKLPEIIHGSNDNNKKEKKYGSKIMKYNPKMKINKYKNEKLLKIEQNNNNIDDEVDYLINNIKSFYEGETYLYNTKVKNGFGVLLQKNGEKKVGKWNNNKFEGWNYWIDEIGSLYIGFFINGKINGKGEKYDLNDEIYFGDFNNNLPDGKGKKINSKYVYEGQFKEGKKEGKGKIIFNNNGDYYEGFFSKDKFNGGGHYFWKNNKYEYFGNYVNGVIEGKGIFKYGDKAIYKGEFKNGVKDGDGEWITKNNKIKGNFKNDLPHGICYLEDIKGFKGYVEFDNGKIINIK